MHSIFRFLNLYPNGCNSKWEGNIGIYLNCKELPSHISKAYVRYKMRYKNINKSSSPYILSKKALNNGFHKIINRKEAGVKNESSFTFQIQIQIVQKYDTKGNEYDDNDNDVLTVKYRIYM